MYFPNEIQKIIKEYSEPIYKKPNHYYAFINKKLFEEILNFTPYSKMRHKLDNNTYYDDIVRGSSLTFNYYYFIINRIQSYTYLTILNDTSLNDVVVIS
jgi:hypothetical protein